MEAFNKLSLEIVNIIIDGGFGHNACTASVVCVSFVTLTYILNHPTTSNKPPTNPNLRSVSAMLGEKMFAGNIMIKKLITLGFVDGCTYSECLSFLHKLVFRLK